MSDKPMIEVAVEQFRAMATEVVALRAEVEQLKNERSRADRAWLVGAPHAGSSADCPTFYDGCRCTVDTLDHNIRRAEAAERARDEALVELFESRALEMSHAGACVRLKRECDEAVAEVKFYKDREAHYSKLLNVADRGQYRADWDGAIDRLKRERDEAVAEVARLKEALSQVLDDETGDYDFIKWTARRALGRTDGEGA